MVLQGVGAGRQFPTRSFNSSKKFSTTINSVSLSPYPPQAGPSRTVDHLASRRKADVGCMGPYTLGWKTAPDGAAGGHHEGSGHVEDDRIQIGTDEGVVPLYPVRDILQPDASSGELDLKGGCGESPPQFLDHGRYVLGVTRSENPHRHAEHQPVPLLPDEMDTVFMGFQAQVVLVDGDVKRFSRSRDLVSMNWSKSFLKSSGEGSAFLPANSEHSRLHRQPPLGQRHLRHGPSDRTIPNLDGHFVEAAAADRLQELCVPCYRGQAQRPLDPLLNRSGLVQRSFSGGSWSPTSEHRYLWRPLRED